MVSKLALGDYACVEIYRMVIDECKKGYNTSFFGPLLLFERKVLRIYGNYLRLEIF